ncbi:hypothetical protein SPRG_04938 [Saprolegnia parasitica CBS 223.65]|uniref:Uncharacterized protein n=1 Tax=Saprolegnia parasitica (strain CBS 223.65) TaxID=695850 RepID=A0A067CTL0_SAPPC|nr:hypothetical protein SPRG_04938 [Saprolegnia parasitica CBS 223.65]KDO29871.1 hypothetical protein SPRG_04938 [Saprolegnia parasitica CBS 223.65]|eukprot:XP_012199466.1 hypothetical protein SPRG_04938 [Saprolegnia parasitica CBS 223.65]
MSAVCVASPPAEDDWDMPLLFMTSLPTNFKVNADIAALASFTDDYEVQDKTKFRSSSRHVAKPYAKSKKANMAELQVCMKFFNM